MIMLMMIMCLATIGGIVDGVYVMDDNDLVGRHDEKMKSSEKKKRRSKNF